MAKLYLTTCFHGNLGYSSIPESKYKEVIEKCYWPIIRLVGELDIKIGLEFPGKTLEIIKELDPTLIGKIKQLIEEGKVEFIGSGYVQSIFPLIPAEVNIKNLEMGNGVYEKILGVKPKTAFVNEQVYSKGLVEIYNKSGYESLIIDWVNSVRHNRALSECKFSTTSIKGVGDERIKVIWNNSIFFQKLQRYVYGDIDLKEYIEFVKSNMSIEEDRVMMLYGNDMEVFDFRPRDPKTLHSGDVKEKEMEKIKLAFEKLKEEKDIGFILPSDSIKKCYLDQDYDVGSAEAPIITKKQEKYNVLRWAVCGKNNYESNSMCYKAYHLLLNLKKDEASNEEDWGKLVEFWASDFRTHTEEVKWNKFRADLKLFIRELKSKTKTIEIDNMPSEDLELKDNTIETKMVILKLCEKKGGTIKELKFKEICEKPIIKTIPHGYYEDIEYAMDFFSGHTLVFDGKKQITDLSKTIIKAKEFDNFIRAECEVNLGSLGLITKRYIIYKNESKLDVELILDLKREVRTTFLRTMIYTINPETFDKNNLSYSIVNGGLKKERYVFGKSFDQASPVDFRFSARSCLGSTNGELVIGDKNKEIILTTDKSETYSVPMIKFENLEGSYFLRVFNTLIENDETSDCFFDGINKLSFSLIARKVTNED